jgi:hypothetical protein
MEQDARLSRLEDALARLAEAQARTEVAVSQLAAAQVRLEERLERVETRVEQVEARLERVETALARLAEAQARTDAQLQALAEAQRRTEEQLVRLGLQVEELVSWQRGEAGRREGERYERDVVRRALVLFNGGYGGSPDNPEVQRRLAGLLLTPLAEDIIAAEADPFLAELLWWKRGQLAVVEVSVQVNGENVRRAILRAETLRRGGAQAVAVVIGESWATLDSRERAHTAGIAWKVGADLSEGFLALRRLAPADGAGPG